MKKTVSLLALLAALCCLFTVSAAAADAPTSGTCGENLTWTLDGAGTLTISGTGAMEEFDYYGAPWRQNRDSIKNVVIENGVTTIGRSAFCWCPSLTSVTIPKSVTSIGERAFYGCTSLTGITIPESVTLIGESAFYQCTALTNVTIPESVTSVGDFAFSGCNSLTSVTIPKSVTSIGERAFDRCASLTGVTFAGESPLTTIGKGAFRSCESLTDVSITNMDAWCRIDFGDSSANPMCRAQNIRLNGSKIASVTVPEGVTELNYTFSGFKDLIRVTLPKSLAGIGEGTFYNCSSLTSVTFAGDSQLTTIGSSAFSGCSSLTGITIPEGVTTISDGAFSGCTSLTSVTIPEGVTTIGSSAFSGCSSLTSVTIPESVTSIGYDAFSSCGSLASVELPKNLTVISHGTFSSCGLTSVTIPEGVTSIGYDAFFRCSSLTSITIPEGVTSIGDGAFYWCSSLTGVYISDLNAWCGINFGDEYANPLYSAKNLYLNGQLVEALEIPGSVSVIPTGLFRNATCLKRVAIPRSLAGVAANAFENCTNITEVFYEGSESEWANLPIAAGNDPLKNAQVYFGSTLENYYCRITVAVSDGGRVTVDHTTAKVGETVTVTAAPYPGYELAAICVDGADIEGNTFTVTGNHVVSARFTRVPVVGGNEDFRLEGISVRTAAGEELQELPQESLLVTVAVKHLKESGSGTILLAQYDSLGRYRGLMWLTLDEMPQGMTLRVTLPVDNSGGEIANLKVFVVEDLTSPLPVGTPVSFGQV